MAITFKTTGIILNCRDYKEADRLYTIYTKDYGKLILRAQGVKKINSKLAGHLEPINKSDLFIAEAKGFAKIGGAQIIDSYLNIKKDLQKISIANQLLAIVDNLITGEQKDYHIFILLSDYLNWLNNNKVNELINRSFIIKLLDQLGYQPDYSKFSGELAKILNFLSKGEWKDIQKLRISTQQWQQISIIFNNYLKTHLSNNLQTVKFIL